MEDDIFVQLKPGEKYAEKNAETANSPVWPDASRKLRINERAIDLDLGVELSLKIAERLRTKTEFVITDHGIHLIYLNSPDHPRPLNGVCALGFPIETKTPKNCPNGPVVKRNGVMREIVNPGMREVVPWYFTSGKKYNNLVGMGEGGRNSALFVHKQKLDNSPDTEWICRLINDLLFDKPLDEREFQTVIRDYHGTSSGNSPYDLATCIINEFRCVVYQGSIWWKPGAEYITDTDNRRLQQLIFQRCPGEQTRFVEEITKQIGIRAPKIESSDLPIVLQNGILDNGEFVDFKGYSDFSPYHISIPFIPNAPAVPEVDEYIDQLSDNDPDYRLLLGEILGYCFITNPAKIKSIAKFFIIRGNGANGKSTLLTIIRRILGPQNCTALSIKEIADTRYRASMRGMLANLGDDCEPSAISDSEMRELKTITSADTTEIRPLYHHSERLTLTTKLFFTTNADIKTIEKGYALQRRLVMLPMFNVVQKPDPRFIEKLTTEEALKYWIRLAVEGYQRLYENLSFTQCEKVREYNEQYHKYNNHMAQFLDDVNIETSILGHTPTEVQEAYNHWNDEPRRVYSSKLLKEELAKRNIGLAMKNTPAGQRRVFMRQEDTKQPLFA